MASKSLTQNESRKRGLVSSSLRRVPSRLTRSLAILGLIGAAVVVSSQVSGAGASSLANSSRPVSATILKELTGVSLAEFNAVGVTSNTTAVGVPTILKSEPLLSVKLSKAVSVPWVVYIGAEFCPFCAAERWPLIVALSRCGKWSGLGTTSSYSGDIYPNTASFTFAQAKYLSPYLSFSSVEEFHNYLNAAGTSYAPFQSPTAQESALFSKFDTSPYTSSAGSIPFVSIGGRAFVFGASFTPAVLANLSQAQIAKDLTSASSSVGRPIIATANMITAGICYSTKDLPHTVCLTKGVEAATKALKL